MAVGQIVRDVQAVKPEEGIVFGDKEKRVYGSKRVEYDEMRRMTKIMLGTGYASLAVGSAIIGARYGLNMDATSIREGLESCFQSYPALVSGAAGAAHLGVCFGRAAFESQSRNYLSRAAKVSIAAVTGVVSGSLVGTGIGGAATSAGYLIGRAVGAFW